MRTSTFLFSLLTVIACGDSSTAPPPEYPPATDNTATVTVAEAKTELVTEAKEVVAKAPPPSIVAVPRTPIEGDAPTLAFVAPRNKQLLKSKVSVRLNLKGWELGAAPGKHVHLIVDNEPYIAIRDTSKPIDLLALVKDKLGHDLSEGTHVLRAFPSRGHHESVKVNSPFASRVFHYKKKTKDFRFDPKAPLLTFSRPKGCTVTGKRLMLDFYVSNAELAADKHKVSYQIAELGGSGDPFISGNIETWTPHDFNHIPVGDYEMTLALLDASGSPVPGPFNSTSRTIIVKDSCE